MVAAKLANMKRGDVGNGRKCKVDGSNDLPTADAAKLLQVSDKSVKRAKQVVERGSKELEEYVEQRWDMSYSRAHDLIQSAETSQNLLNSVDFLPAKESHVRELLKLCEDRKDLYAKLVKYRPKGKRGGDRGNQYTGGKVNNVNDAKSAKGNSRLYIEERLERDHPEIWKCQMVLTIALAG
jgi:hypothetical protein